MRADLPAISVAIATCVSLLGAATMSRARAGTPEVRIATESLLDARAIVPPNVLLSLSIDRITVGAAYRSGSAARYNRTLAYDGYFNPLKCYAYAPAPSAYFEISDSVVATNLHECDGTTFSGNFMNWASMSTIDLLRYGLTGGDRVTPESTTLTILQRAMLPTDFFSDPALFPSRTISSSAGGNVSAPAKVTPFSQATIKLVSCENKIIIAEAATPITTCSLPLTSRGRPVAGNLAGEYLLRVKVCDAAEGPGRTDLCEKYGDNYKPVGILQRNADKMRVGLMSYLADGGDTNRYGGVLRAPIKYLGPRKFDGAGFNETSNDLPEWDSATGILYANPDNPAARDSSTVKSGLINYINQFGRTGTYRYYDPVSELFYEGLRYLQGKQPTADATGNMSEAMKDGYPVITTWNDPVLAACQRNQIALIADASTNYDFYVPGNTRTDMLDASRPVDAAVANKTPAVNARQWTRKLGELEADASIRAGNPPLRSNPNPPVQTNPVFNWIAPNLDDGLTGNLLYGSFYVSGLAYWANTNDIRVDKPVRVKTFMIDLDEGGNGQIDYAARMPSMPRESQLFLAAKYGSFDDVSGEASAHPFVSLASDGVTKIRNSNLAWDANRDGLPDNYFLASQPGALVKALRKLTPGVPGFSSMTLAAPAVATTRLIPAESFLYQAGFRAPQWTGSLKKLKISAAAATNSASALRLATAAEWDAGSLLTNEPAVPGNPTPTTRKIFTAKRGADNSLQTIAFAWPDLSVDQQAILNKSALDAATDNLGTKRVDYLRGVRTDEAGQPAGVMRHRLSLLGDIINSNVVHVGAPTQGLQGTSYKLFHERHKDRSPTLYVGANDGMLHAFDAASGIEKFAYIPKLLLPQLSQLTSPDYAHRPFVDGQIAVSEALVRTHWKTVLASGFGGGAQGVFALDITDPADFTNGGVLFEFSDADDAAIGNLMGPPVIAKFKTAVNNGVPAYTYFVVVPSGLNNYKIDGATPATATAALFLLSLDKPAAEAWTLGVNYYKIALPVLNPAQQNGVSPPALAVGADGAVRYAYLGDLQGNLWRLDFTGLPPWSSARGSLPDQPLFSAVDAQNPARPQAITMQPKIIFAPGGGYVVLFGTGKFYELADLAPGNFIGQSFYAIYDSTVDTYRVASRSELKQRFLTLNAPGDRYTIIGNEFMYAPTPGFESLAQKGWYLDFINGSTTGERAVASPVVVDGQLYFNTIVPGSDPCNAGSGRAYSMDALYGTSGNTTTAYATSVGLLSAPVVFQMGASTPGHRNAIGKRVASKNLRVLHVGAGAGGETPQSVAAAAGNSVQVDMPAGRFSWREIVNWQEMRAAAMRSVAP